MIAPDAKSFEDAMAAAQRGDADSAIGVLAELVFTEAASEAVYDLLIELLFAKGRTEEAEGFLIQGLDHLEASARLRAKYRARVDPNVLRPSFLRDKPYVVAAPVWSDPMRFLSSAIGTFIEMFSAADGVTLFLPTMPDGVQDGLSITQAIAAELQRRGMPGRKGGFAPIVLEPVYSDPGLRQVIYGSEGVYVGDGAEPAVVMLAQNYGCRLIEARKHELVDFAPPPPQRIARGTIRFQPRDWVKPESVYLQRSAKNVTSQFGEDGIIQAIFKIMEPKHRYCVEFGAWDGEHFSNTWSLINEHGWSGLLLEGDPERFGDLQRTYAGIERATLMSAYVDLADNALDVLLRKAGAPTDLDLLCIDIDGLDWYVWRSLREFRPRLVVIEFNFTVPNDVVFIQECNPEIRQGSSLAALIELGREKGYELIATTESNAFFVPLEEFPHFDIADNDIWSMRGHHGSQSRIFQLYDGTLVLAGNDRLIWSNRIIEHEAIQVVPPEERRLY